MPGSTRRRQPEVICPADEVDAYLAGLEGYERTSGSRHFSIDEPLPDDPVRALVDAKLAILER